MTKIAEFGLRIRLGAILLLAASLRFVGLDGVVGGFHAFNEAHYLLIAKNFRHGSLLFPTPDGRYLFLETPPLFAYLLAGIFRVTGISVLAGRALSIAFSIGLVLAVFALSRRLFGASAGIAAALITAVTPVAVLTGRNIQTDSALLFFLTVSLVFYLQADQSGRLFDWLLWGTFLGFALFTKLFAVLVLPALVAWEFSARKGIRSLLDPRRLAGAGAALFLPGLFYGFHAIRNFAYLKHDVTGGALAATTFPATAADWIVQAKEVWWALSPGVAVVLTVGLAVALRRPGTRELFAILLFAVYLAFFLAVHKHSYYLLTTLPFGAALAGRWLAELRRRSVRLALLCGIAITGAFFSLVDLESMKMGFSEFAEFGVAATLLQGNRHWIVAGGDLLASHGPVVRYYDPKAELFDVDSVAADAEGRLDLPAEGVALLSFVPPSAQPVPYTTLLSRTRYGLELLGLTIAEAHPNPNFFQQGSYVVRRTGPLTAFSFRAIRTYPALELVPVPADDAIVRGADGFRLEPR